MSDESQAHLSTLDELQACNLDDLQTAHSPVGGLQSIAAIRGCLVLVAAELNIIGWRLREHDELHASGCCEAAFDECVRARDLLARAELLEKGEVAS